MKHVEDFLGSYVMMSFFEYSYVRAS